MDVIVCIKQVPDTVDVRINPETNTLVREGVESIVNPMDMYAIEEGLRIKEKHGGRVTAITMGPPQAESALREAISLGADEGILITDHALAGSDTWATSLSLAAAIRKIGDYGIILCGKQAIDGDTAQVGPGIAAHLDLPQITFVRKIEEISDKKIRAERLMEDGYQVIESTLPAVLTVVKEINEPRLPSLRGKMAARKAEITAWGLEELGLSPDEVGINGSPTIVKKIFTPERKTEGKIFTGDARDTVKELIDALKADKII